MAWALVGLRWQPTLNRAVAARCKRRWTATGHALRASSSLSLTVVIPLAQRPPALQAGGPWPPPPPAGGPGGAGGGGVQQLFNLAAAALEPVTLTLASFAVTKLAYVRLTKQFRELYLKEKGVDVRFRLTFAGSGVQVRAATSGLTRGSARFCLHKASRPSDMWRACACLLRAGL